MPAALMHPHRGVGRSAGTLTHSRSALAHLLAAALRCGRLSAAGLT